MTIYALSLTFVGRIYDRYGPKLVLILHSIFIAVGYMGISFIESYWQFFFFYSIILAIGLAGPSISFLSALVSKWFETSRGLAVGLALSGTCLGQFVLVPVLTDFVIRYGWRALYFWIGLITLGINILLTLLVIKGDPGHFGVEPFGLNKNHRTEYEKSKESANQSKDFGLWEAMRTRSYLLFLFVMFVCGGGDYFVATHLIPFATDTGISTTTAGHMLALFGLFSLFGLLVAGPASDFIGSKIPLAITFLMRFILCLIILKYKNLGYLYTFSLAFGFTFLISANLNPILMGKLYGLSHIGLLSGFITTLHHIGAGFWAYVGGLVHDYTGGYQLIFLLLALMSFLTGICCFLIKEERHYPIVQQSIDRVRA